MLGCRLAGQRTKKARHSGEHFIRMLLEAVKAYEIDVRGAVDHATEAFLPKRPDRDCNAREMHW